MKRLSAALATLLLMGTSAIAAPPAPPAGAGGDAVAAAPGPDANAANPGSGKDGGPATRPGMPPFRPNGPGGMMRPPRPDLAMHLATRLAAAETLIGIRADQLDAWRTYTGALIDLLTPPPPPAFAAGPDGNFLDRQEQLATRIRERAAKADALLAAITGLKAKLTPEQVERLGKVELMMHPPGRPGWGGRPGDDGNGPRPGGPGRGPWQPAAGPGPGPGPEGGPANPGELGPADGPDAPALAPPQDDEMPPAPPAPDIPDTSNQRG